MCLYFMTVGQLQQSSGNSAPNSGNNHHLTIPFDGGMHSFKKTGCVCKRTSTGRPSGTDEQVQQVRQTFLLMSVVSQRVHIQSTCKVCNKNLECCSINPLNAELNPICYLLALLGAHRFLHVSRIRVKSLTLSLLMSYMYIYIWSTYS